MPIESSRAPVTDDQFPVLEAYENVKVVLADDTLEIRVFAVS
jgi:hypothetical protein